MRSIAVDPSNPAQRNSQGKKTPTLMATQRAKRPQVNSGRGRPEWDLSYESEAGGDDTFLRKPKRNTRSCNNCQNCSKTYNEPAASPAYLSDQA